MRNRLRRAIPALLPAGALIALTFLWHGEAVQGWWLEDDPQLLVQALRETPGSILFSPQRWRLYSASNFVPLVTLAYQFDVRIFGLDPRFFYLHHLVVMAVAVVLCFFLVDGFADRVSAFLAGFAILAAPATVYAARTLMVRHYVEGVCFSVGALLLWRRRDWRWAPLWAALLYFLAALSKEVFAPLPLLMALISVWQSEPLRRAALRVLPTAVAAAVYAAWRTVMLGSIGGYGDSPTPGQLARIPLSLWGWIRGEGLLIAGMVWLVVMLLIVWSAMRSSPIFGGFAAATVVLFACLPLVPLGGSPLGFRFAFVPTVVLLCSVIAAASRLGAGRRRVALAWLVAAVAVAGVFQRPITQAAKRRMAAEGKYVWNQAGGASPLLASSHIWYIDGLRFLRRTRTPSEPPRVLHSLHGIVLERIDPASMVEIGSSGEPGPLSAERRTAARTLARSRVEVPPAFQLRLRHRNHVLEWSVSDVSRPWLYATMPGYELHPRPPAGSYRFPREAHPPTWRWMPDSQSFRAIVRVNAGRWAATPPLPFPRDGSELVWPATSRADAR